MEDHIVIVGYTPISIPEMNDFYEADSAEQIMQIVGDKLSKVKILGSMIFGQPKVNKADPESGWDHDWYAMLVVEKHCQELNTYLHAFINDEVVKDVKDKLELVVNVNSDGSAIAGIVPNPLLSIVRQKKIRSYSKMTLVMPIVSVLIQQYAGSTLSKVRDELDGKTINLGYIDRHEMEEILLAQDKEEQKGWTTPLEEFQLALSMNDWPEAKMRYTNAEGDGGEGLLRAAMERVPELVDEGENVTVMMVT